MSYDLWYRLEDPLHTAVSSIWISLINFVCCESQEMTEEEAAEALMLLEGAEREVNHVSTLHARSTSTGTAMSHTVIVFTTLYLVVCYVFAILYSLEDGMLLPGTGYGSIPMGRRPRYHLSCVIPGTDSMLLWCTTRSLIDSQY